MKIKEDLKKWIILIVVAVLSYWTVNNIELILGIVSKIIKVLSPFIIGIALAYILNIPMVKTEHFLRNKIKNKNFPFRIISIIVAIMILILVVSFVAFMLIPELIENIELLIQNIPILISNIEKWLLGLLDKYPDIQKEIGNMFAETSISGILMSVLNYILNSSINLISNLVSGLITIFTSLVFAIYMLSQKEHLLSSLNKIINLYFKEKFVNKFMEIAKLSNKVFSKFISGQCVEAVILGFIFFVVLSIFRFPYALLISVLTAVTALIPFFGALIAMVVGAILIAITNPLQALIFVVVFQIIQQIENNFIYPKVVGKSVGLSPIWTLLAVTVGGGLFGVVGMLVGLPIASILYYLFINDAKEKIKINSNEKETILD